MTENLDIIRPPKKFHNSIRRISEKLSLLNESDRDDVLEMVLTVTENVINRILEEK